MHFCAAEILATLTNKKPTGEIPLGFYLIQNRKVCPSLCLFYFANNQNYITREWLLLLVYLGNDFSFEVFGLLMPSIDFDYLQFDKENAGSPCCAKDQRCLRSSRLLPSLILQCRISELIAFSSIWHFIFHISSSNYCNILSFKASWSENIAYLIKSIWYYDIQPGLTQLTSVCSILGSYISNFLTEVDCLASVNTLNTHILWLLSYHCKKKKSVQRAVLQKQHAQLHSQILFIHFIRIFNVF